MVFQDSYASLNPRLTIDETMAFAPKAHGLADAEARGARRAICWPRSGSIPTASPSAIRTSCRAASASGSTSPAPWRCEPRLVILDEAVSALDKSVEAQVLNMLVDLKDELGLTYLFISHDLNVVQYLSDRVLVMYLGKIVEIGPVEAIYGDPQHPYTRALLVGAADDGPAPAHHRGADPGRSAQPDRSAVGLPLPHPLPVRRGRLRRAPSRCWPTPARRTVACHMRVRGSGHTKAP